MTVLALRAAGLGDLLTAVPALRALSQSGSGGSADVVVATNRWLFDLVPLIPGVSGVV